MSCMSLCINMNYCCPVAVNKSIISFSADDHVLLWLCTALHYISFVYLQLLESEAHNCQPLSMLFIYLFNLIVDSHWKKPSLSSWNVRPALIEGKYINRLHSRTVQYCCSLLVHLSSIVDGFRIWIWEKKWICTSSCKLANYHLFIFANRRHNKIMRWEKLYWKILKSSHESMKEKYLVFSLCQSMLCSKNIPSCLYNIFRQI